MDEKRKGNIGLLWKIRWGKHSVCIVFVFVAFFLSGLKAEAFTGYETALSQEEGDIVVTDPIFKLCTITYDANGGEGAPFSEHVISGETIELSDIAPMRDGHYFKGWATSSSASEAEYQPGAEYIAEGDVTLYAVWGINLKLPLDIEFPPILGGMTTITYDANGGEGAPEPQSIPRGTLLACEYTLSDKIPTREGYVFLGWATSPTAVQAEYQPGGYEKPDGIEVTLYAVWKKVPAKKPGIETEALLDEAEQIYSSEELKTPAKENNKKIIETSNISLKSSSGVTEADKYMALGKIKVGKKKFILKLITSGVKNLTYKSSNKKIAIINRNGAVKIKKIGTVIITVTATVIKTGKVISKKYLLKINPSKTTLQSVKSTSAGKMSISWKKNTSGQGYQISYSSSRNFKNGTKSFNISKSSITKIMITDLMRKVKYYVRVRSYKAVSGKPYYGAWSKVKAVKIK